MTSSKPVVAVTGAMGMQGGGLVRAILNDPNSPFQVRALTRDPNKGKALELKAAGAEVVAFDMDDPTTFPEAFKGVHALFIVTAFFEHLDPEKEANHVKTILAAAEPAGVKHYIWSTLEDTRPFFDSLPEDQRPPKLGDGKYYTPHMDMKGSLCAVFPKDKTTCLFTSFYMENIYVYQMVNNGTFYVNVHDMPLPIISCEDIGKCAYGILLAGDEYKGQDVYIAGDRMSPKDFMKLISDETGKPFQHVYVDRATYAGFGFPNADDYANMFEFQRLDPHFTEARDPSVAKKINPTLLDAKAWVKLHKDEILTVGPKE